jgi:hypothetical protein
MRTPLSVRSMGLTSSGHPRLGSGGPTEPLRHRRSAYYALPAPGRMLRDAPPAAGPDWVDPLGRGSREWSEGGARHAS